MNILQEEILEDDKYPFEIENLETANWCFRKLEAYEAKKKEIKALADAEKQRIELWSYKEIKQLEDSMSYFKGLLMGYYKKQRAMDNRFKLSTPYGKVSSRKTKNYIYEDEQAIIDFCNVNELDCINVVEKLNKAEFKKLCKDGVNLETWELFPWRKIEEVETVSIKTIGGIE